MVRTSQPVRAIQPTIGMMKMRPWTTILLNQLGSWKGHAKLSPTLVTAGSVTPDRETREACARAARAAVESQLTFVSTPRRGRADWTKSTPKTAERMIRAWTQRTLLATGLHLLLM